MNDRERGRGPRGGERRPRGRGSEGGPKREEESSDILSGLLRAVVTSNEISRLSENVGKMKELTFDADSPEKVGALSRMMESVERRLEGMYEKTGEKCSELVVSFKEGDLDRDGLMSEVEKLAKENGLDLGADEARAIRTLVEEAIKAEEEGKLTRKGLEGKDAYKKMRTENEEFAERVSEVGTGVRRKEVEMGIEGERDEELAFGESKFGLKDRLKDGGVDYLEDKNAELGNKYDSLIRVLGKIESDETKAYCEKIRKIKESGGTLSAEDEKKVWAMVRVADKARKSAEKMRNDHALEGLRGGMPRRSRSKLSGKTFRFFGNNRRRMGEALGMCSFKDGSRDDEVRFLVEVLNFSGKSRSRAVKSAEQAWEKSREWREKVGDVEEGLSEERIRYESFVAPGGRGVREGAARERDREELRRIYRDFGLGDLAPGESRGRDEWLDRNVSGVPGRVSEMLRRQMEGWSDEEKGEYIAKEVEKAVIRIMNTQESSRDPKNQEASWTLFAYLGMSECPDQIRNMWSARLAMYDAGIIMGSVEEYEDWVKVQGFLWRGAVNELWGDELKLSLDNGDKLLPDFGVLSFRDVFSGLEEYASQSSKELWIGKILGAKNDDDRELAMRQFMAYLMAKRQGVELINTKGEFIFGDLDETMKNKLMYGEGDERKSVFEYLGLDENGNSIEIDGKDDLFKRYAWYLESGVTHSHLTLRSVYHEGGRWWRDLPNGLRKIHGLAMKHYFSKKDMGAHVFLREDFDSLWRSIFAWKADNREIFFQGFENKMNWEDKKKKNFYKVLDRIVMTDHLRDPNNRYGKYGEIRSNGRVRDIAFDKRFQGEYGEIKRLFREKLGEGFDWAGVLKHMGVESTGNVRGLVGLEVFLKKFDYWRLIDNEGMPHNLLHDFGKYSGGSNQAFLKMIDIASHPSHEAVTELMMIIGGYHGSPGKDVLASRMIPKLLNYQQRRFSGYETHVDEEGKERSVAWKINYEDPVRARKEERMAREMGYIVVDGNVLTAELTVVYRSGKIGFFEGVTKPFAPLSKGFPFGRFGYKGISFKEMRKEIRDYYRNDVWSGEQYVAENMRLFSKIWLDVELPRAPQSLGEMVKLVGGEFAKRPWKLLALPYTIIVRGIIRDWLDLDWDDFFDFIRPMEEELKKAFG